MTEQVDWEGLKALEAKALETRDPVDQWEFWRLVGLNYRAILAQRERDQRVIEAAKKLIDALENRVNLNHMLAARAEFDKVTK